MLRALSLALAALAVLAAGSLWLVFFPPVPDDLDGAPDLDAEATHVRIPVAPADSLDGWLLPGTGRGVIVMFHGYGRKHDRLWRYADFLRRDGYTLLAVEFRSSRAANRLPTTLGHHEEADAVAAWAWMRAQPWGAGQPAGAFGESLGGSVALLLAGAHVDVLAIVADCPFASGERALEDTFRRKAFLPPWPSVPAARALGRAATGFDPGAIDVLAAAQRLGDRPVYFIHAGRDDRMAVSQARDLWRAAGAKDSIWLLEGGGHNEAWQTRRDEYERRIGAFYRAHLLEGTARLASGPDAAASGAEAQ